MEKIVKVDTGLDNSLTVKRVRALLKCIPQSSKGWGFQIFKGLRLIRADGVRFTLSIQGSEGHYCVPKRCLSDLSQYEGVEIGIIPDERNESSPYRFGHILDPKEIDFREVKEGDIEPYGEKQLRGWLQPKDVGFKRMQEHQVRDEVLGYFPVRDLVADLAEFFDAGGVIDASHEDTQKWVGKIIAAVQS
ncbi:MAG: hypothetical protein GF409_07400 [Candidatus Omnitrophica bacterium]|nr:hypothetical protein [Candidatus Omnitrophota bacterium]